MKKIYLILALFVAVSCSKEEDIITEEKSIYFDAINELRLNGYTSNGTYYPPVEALNWSDNLYKLSVNTVDYFQLKNNWPDAQTSLTMIKEVGITTDNVCFINLRIAEGQNYDLMKYLKESAGNFIANSKYTSVGIFMKNNAVCICLGYKK